VKNLRGWSASRTSRLIFWAAWAFSLVMAVLPHPPRLPGEPSDKVEHVAAFLTLGLLSAWAYPKTPLIQLLIRLSLFGALIELIQAIPSLSRDSDPLDWLADTIAAAVALGIAHWWRNRSRRPG
jgi:VanZ family protein